MAARACRPEGKLETTSRFMLAGVGLEDRGRLFRPERAIDEETVPDFQHQERPDAVVVVHFSGGVLVEDPLQVMHVEHAPLASPFGEQQVADPLPPVISKPMSYGNTESPLP